MTTLTRPFFFKQKIKNKQKQTKKKCKNEKKKKNNNNNNKNNKNTKNFPMIYLIVTGEKPLYIAQACFHDDKYMTLEPDGSVQRRWFVSVYS